MNDYKNDFPLLKDSNIIYLDSGATSQKPLCVIDAEDEFYKKYNVKLMDIFDIIDLVDRM